MTGRDTRPTARPTLDQVAARAGVGRGTVSRVINGSAQVSPEARAAVEQAVADLGYVPNRAARTLVTRRTDSVALVISESEERLFGEPFFAAVVRGISAGLADTPLQLWLAMSRSPVERLRVEYQLTSQYVDGVMLLSLHRDDPLPAVLAERGLPVVIGGPPVVIGGPPAESERWLGVVDVDNVGGARQAVEHLRRSGRRRIATIAGPQDTAAGVARLAGYRQASDHDLVAYGDFRESGGADAMRDLLERHPDLDAVFAASDLMAVGAMRALREAGCRVPDDVAVVGFEDATFARHTEPALTTVHQPVEAMGREMALMLADLIDGGQPRQVILDTHLVGRGSA
jgi:DNA-binding LacI/PurR family transcriptional regulator